MGIVSLVHSQGQGDRIYCQYTDNHIGMRSCPTTTRTPSRGDKFGPSGHAVTIDNNYTTTQKKPPQDISLLLDFDLWISIDFFEFPLLYVDYMLHWCLLSLWFYPNHSTWVLVQRFWHHRIIIIIKPLQFPLNCFFFTLIDIYMLRKIYIGIPCINFLILYTMLKQCSTHCYWPIDWDVWYDWYCFSYMFIV